MKKLAVAVAVAIAFGVGYVAVIVVDNFVVVGTVELYTVYDEFFASSGRTSSPTPQCYKQQTPPACITCSASNV